MVPGTRQPFRNFTMVNGPDFKISHRFIPNGNFRLNMPVKGLANHLPAPFAKHFSVCAGAHDDFCGTVDPRSGIMQELDCQRADVSDLPEVDNSLEIHAFHAHPLAAVEDGGTGVRVTTSVRRVEEEPVEHVLAGQG